MPNGSGSSSTIQLRQDALGALKASEATLFIATPIHPKSEVHAEEVFGRVLRPGVGGWTREAALAEADAIGESSLGKVWQLAPSADEYDRAYKLTPPSPPRRYDPRARPPHRAQGAHSGA